jgi:hypothetical protein
LIPYSKANWQLLFQKIGKISYNIVEEVIQLNYFPERFYKKKDASTISAKEEREGSFLSSKCDNKNERTIDNPALSTEYA